MDLSPGLSRLPKTPKSFTRSELVRTVYERFELNKAEGSGLRFKKREGAERLVNAVLEEIANALERGLRVELRGLGALSIKDKHERRGRNPRTGEAVMIDARRVVRFRVSELLLARLNCRTFRRPERPNFDPRQLAFPIDDQEEAACDAQTYRAAADGLQSQNGKKTPSLIKASRRER